MHLLYYTGNSILNTQGMAPLLSWGIVVGGLYGCGRLIADIIHAFREYPRTETPHR